MLLAFARARRWQKLIDEGQVASAKALARQIGRDQSHVANIIGMVQISPKIIHAVIRGDYPETLTLATLKRKLPDLWSEQEAMLLGENQHTIGKEHKAAWRRSPAAFFVPVSNRRVSRI